MMKEYMTKDCLYQALLQLMEIKDFQKISIQELVQRAGVSRMSYYRHFANKEDILLERLDYRFAVYYQEIGAYQGQRKEQLRLRFFDYFEEEKVLIKALMDAHLEQELFLMFRAYLKTIFQDLLPDESSSPHILRYELSFLAGGLLQLLLAWIEEDCQTSKEELAQLAQILLKQD